MKRFFSVRKFLFTLGFIFSLSTVIGCCIHADKLNNPHRNNLITHLKKSTVAFVNANIIDEQASHCAGTWINKHHIVTARHCIIDDSYSSSNLDLGKIVKYHQVSDYGYAYPPKEVKNVYTGVVVGMSDEYDVAAIFSIDNVKHHIANIAQYKNIPTGMDVHIIGHPINQRYTYVKGIISASRKYDTPLFDDTQLVLQITASIGPGNSGGGAFDKEGNLIGICSFVNPAVPGMSFFIHKNALIEFLDEEKIKYY